MVFKVSMRLIWHWQAARGRLGRMSRPNCGGSITRPRPDLRERSRLAATEFGARRRAGTPISGGTRIIGRRNDDDR